jgi:hypothetical protein
LDYQTMLNNEARQRLRELLPASMVATKQWLLNQGFSLHFLDNAVRSGTLTPLASGVYTLHGQPVSWTSVVASLQRMAESPIQVGGLSALELDHRTHFLPAGTVQNVQLYSGYPLPRWLNRVPVNAQFEWQGTRRLWPDAIMMNARLTREYSWQEGLPPIIYSCPEKAIMEVLAKVPAAVSFEHAGALTEGLSNLSPRKADVLLRACRSIKVKRLFLWLAERENHAWFRHLKSDDYDLGSGKRVIASNGRLNTRWMITVPKEMKVDPKLQA